ncbi:MAG: DUF1566 domain-containing protein [Candidatus Binatia bacterium]|nr:DUF1566 domain-containing protein [Candidatus Binatia bacterium]
MAPFLLSSLAAAVSPLNDPSCTTKGRTKMSSQTNKAPGVRTTIWTLILSLALTTAAFAATDEQKCQNKKLIALGKRDLCLQQERGKEALGRTPDVAKCAEKFDKGIAAAEKKVACRWLDNGDGTATDLNTGLQWELKTDDGSIHDKDNRFDWSDRDAEPWDVVEFYPAGLSYPAGGAFVDFLGTLNFNQLPAGWGCFAGKCDWRLPTAEELAGIVDLSAPGCFSGSPCTTIPGETAYSFFYGSSTSGSASGAVTAAVVLFDGVTRGGVVTAFANKDIRHFSVRAVRGGS